MFSQLSAPTPLDINFRVGRYPVRVSAWFWLGAAYLGYSYGQRHGPEGLFIWIACQFFSVLLHELGHSVVGRAFGRPSRIVLQLFGGYAEFYDGRPRQGWPCLMMILAGPAVNFAFAGLLYVSDESTQWTDHANWLGLVYGALWFQNFWWAVLNLTPVWPLDGGQALREILYLCRLRRPDPPTHLTGVIVGGALTLVGVAFWIGINPPVPFLVYFLAAGPFMTVFFGFLTYQNLQMYQMYNVARDPWEEDSERWRG